MYNSYLKLYITFFYSLPQITQKYYNGQNVNYNYIARHFARHNN